jgi:hypothetical protein
VDAVIAGRTVETPSPPAPRKLPDLLQESVFKPRAVVEALVTLFED